MDENLNLESFTIGGAEFKTLLTTKYKSRKAYRAPNKKEITAFIPGTIFSVSVKKGAKVKEGQELLILEAMKMKNVLRAPFNGIVKDVYVKKGEMVPKNFLLVELQ